MWSQIQTDFWVHLGGLILIAIGLTDHWFFTAHSFGDQMDLAFILFGAAGLGLKLANGYAKVNNATKGNP